MRPDDVSPGDLLVVIEGRRVQRTTMIGEPIWSDSAGEEDRDCLGLVVRVLSVAAWPLLLCEVEWLPSAQTARASGEVFYTIRFGDDRSENRSNSTTTPEKPKTKQRVFLRVGECRLRRVPEEFLVACRGAQP